MICDLLESTYDFADAPRPAHSGALMPAEVSVMRSCLQQDLGIRNPASLYWLITAGQRAACARFTHSSRSVSELTFTVSQAARGWVHARRPVSGVARCRPGARRPTGRRRRPEASAPSSARPRGVFSEMPPRNRALGDGGAGQVHGQASVRLEPLASGRDAAAPRGARGKSLS